MFFAKKTSFALTTSFEQGTRNRYNEQGTIQGSLKEQSQNCCQKLGILNRAGWYFTLEHQQQHGIKADAL